MNRDGRLARMAHVLIHMALLEGRETSETIARMLNTNAVVVRRTMAALKRHGIVSSDGGRGGGWTLLKGLDDLTLLDVHRALGGGQALQPKVALEHPNCPVERATQSALDRAFQSAAVRLLEELGRVKLSDIARTAVGGAYERKRSR